MCVRCGECYRFTLTTCDVVCCNVILMSGGVVSVCCNVYAVCEYPKEGSLTFPTQFHLNQHITFPLRGRYHFSVTLFGPGKSDNTRVVSTAATLT